MSQVIEARSSTAADQQEWQLRCDMAAVFRIAARHGWNEQIGNHNSLMLPGDRPLFLINPRGRLFQELTASSLIVCDLDGRVVRGEGELRKVAFHIHARIHLRRPEAACVMHV
ncbi:MAG: class II aldolase/adducin family protein, partial [Gemmatimonadaceae bacterium]|nr:class II aldolase/adducin family protein [Acetobacteraceae bacterium]